MSAPVHARLAFAPSDEEGWQELSRGYRLAGLLLSAHRLGLLRRLATGPATTAALADELVGDEGLLERMCRALEAAGMLARGIDGWELSAQGRRLTESREAAVELDALGEDYDAWGHLDRSARRLALGEPRNDLTGDYQRVGEPSAARRYAVRRALRHRGQVSALLDRLRPTRALRVVDVGGADGLLARELVRRWPDASCLLLEQPGMAAVAREACAAEPGVTVVEGDFFGDADGPGARDALPGPVDVVVLSHVLQGLSAVAQRDLVLRAVRDLTPGGCVVSSEFVLRSDDRGPLDVLLWAVGQASTRGPGNLLNLHDQDALLRAAGLAACGEWWPSSVTRAVLGVRPDVGAQPALRLREP